MLAHPWSAVAFTEADDPRRYHPHNQRYMHRLIAHIREQDKVCRRSGPGTPWWWTYEGAGPPLATGGSTKRTGFASDAAKDGALADTRLGEMLGTRLQSNGQPSFDMLGLVPQDGECDVRLLMEMEGWGLPTDYVMKSFRSFPYNHSAASYAILEHRYVTQRELSSAESSSGSRGSLDQQASDDA